MKQDNCSSCNGKGKYVGATTVEDPCHVCVGLGVKDPFLTMLLDTIDFAIEKKKSNSDMDVFILSADSAIEGTTGFSVVAGDRSTKHFSVHLSDLKSSPLINHFKSVGSSHSLIKSYQGRMELATILMRVSRGEEPSEDDPQKVKDWMSTLLKKGLPTKNNNQHSNLGFLGITP